MPFNDPQAHLEDILASIEAIESFLTQVDFPYYCADLKTRSAVERQLQILTEAAFRLREDAARLCPTVDWRDVRGLGNALRHEYDFIDDEVIWQAIQTRLPLLKSAVQNALKATRNEKDTK